MDAPLPDLVVAVDFGMTCTGVAYQNLAIRSETVQWINRWPGRSQAIENKVPTVLVYTKEHPTQPTSWGFQSEDVAEQFADDKVFREWFKVYLDKRTLAERQRSDKLSAPRSLDEVKKWYGDYLRKLYDHIEFKLAPHLPGKKWDEAMVEYVFSVPTTWSLSVVESFRKIIRNGGFGGCAKHSVLIDLTEAEAAAVFASREMPGIFQTNETLLVCDAGGGTSDLSVLRILETRSSMRMEQLDVVQGRSIGSTAIDYSFQELVRRRLDGADNQSPLGINIQDTAWEMMKSKEFQNSKCEIGSPDEPSQFKLPIRGLRVDYKDLIAGIEVGFMTFTNTDLRRLFDKQIEKLLELIDRQLHSIQLKLPKERIAHLILSGGLGNSAYVHEKLSACYQSADCVWQSAQGMQVHLSPDPQMAVCKGLIVNRIAKLRSNRSTIGVRCCRASYGSLCKELYSPARHGNITPELDPLNGKLYVTNVVEWFIKKGEPVKEDEPVIRPYKRRLEAGSSVFEIDGTIVMCDLKPRRLPYRFNSRVKCVCDVRATIQSTDDVVYRDNRFRPWKKGKGYAKVDFEIRIAIGPADLRFELWRNGTKMDGERSIKVDFAPVDDRMPSSRLKPTKSYRLPKPPSPILRQSQHLPESSGLTPVITQFFAQSERRAEEVVELDSEQTARPSGTWSGDSQNQQPSRESMAVATADVTAEPATSSVIDDAHQRNK